MLNCQVVRAVALLLPLDQKDSREQHLLIAVVKALAVFTKHRSYECAQQVTCCESGDSSHDSPMSFMRQSQYIKLIYLLLCVQQSVTNAKCVISRCIHPFFSVSIV
jgi:hypothetical protein